MNTKVSYMYRDASNYKEGHSEIFTGEITPEQEQLIRDNLYDGDGFIPQQVGLEALQIRMMSFPSEDDHCWHELVEFTLTKQTSTRGKKISEFANRFKDIIWDEVKYAINVSDDDED